MNTPAVAGERVRPSDPRLSRGLAAVCLRRTKLRAAQTQRVRLKRIMAGRKGYQRPTAVLRIPRLVVDRFFMRRVLRLAAVAAVAGEVPVAALVVRRGIVLATAVNRVERDGSGLRHAEVLALDEISRRWGRRLYDMTLYVNVEPCVMCAAAMVHARLGRLVYGTDDPERGGCGSQVDVSALPGSLHRVRVTKGIYADAARAQMQVFFSQRR